MVTDTSSLVTIDRNRSFHTSLLARPLTIVEQDEEAVKLVEIDLTRIVFVKSDRTDQERFDHIKSIPGHACLDAQVFWHLWQNKALIPEHFKEQGWITFDGTVFEEPDGSRLVICMGFGKVWRRWRQEYIWFQSDIQPTNVSSALIPV
jgi:hypothetical protein